MASLLRIARLLILLLIAVTTALLAYLFYIANTDPVALRFLDWRTPELPLWAWLLAAMVVGYLFGVLSMAGVNLRLLWRVRRAERGRGRNGPASSGSKEARDLPNPVPG